MEIPNQPASLAEFLEISLEALRKQMKRKGLVEGRFNRHAKMDEQTIQLLLEVYGHDGTGQQLSTSIETDKPPNRQLDKQPVKQTTPVKQTNGRADTFSIETDIQTGRQTDRPSKKQGQQTNGQTTTFSIEEDKRTNCQTDNQTMLQTASSAIETDTHPRIDYAELSKDVLLALIAMVSMYVQMNHTAQVVGGEWLQAWAYALSIQFTGLAMTLYKGSLWYLRIFALAEFSINLLHYRPWTCELLEGVSVCGGAEEWTRSLLLSALIAFTIYSYVEIFAARRNEKTDTP